MLEEFSRGQIAEMTLINASLLLGLVLAALPVVLHLVMRARPKRIEFPALRLLKSRQPSNARRMQLRHWMLLLLRAALISILVLAIARPSLPAARYGLRWWEWLTLAGIAAAVFLLYRWLSVRDRNSHLASHQLREVRSRRRMWSVIGGMAAILLAVGVPWGIRVRGELLSPRNDAMENIPVAAVFVFDTSYSMNYRHENSTRLDVAREVAREHLSQLPTGSRAAIAGLSPDEDVVFQADLTGAQSRMDSLQLTSVPEVLNRRVKSAIQSQVEDRERLQAELGLGSSGDLFAREICILTDMSQSAWVHPDESGLADALKQHDWLQIYVVDTGVTNPANFSFSNLKLSEETSVPGREVLLTVTASATAARADSIAVVETFLLDPTGKDIRIGRQNVTLQNGAAEMQTVIRTPEKTTAAEGFVRLVTSDPLPEDSIRYFTFGVRPKPRLLMISDRPDLAESFYLKNVLQPDSGEKQGLELYDCTRISSTQFSQQSLNNYDVVCLINTQRPPTSLWTSLKGFAESGGGVFIVAGTTGISPGHWSTADSKELLPAVPLLTVNYTRQLGEPQRIRIVNEQHSITRPFVQLQDARTELSRALFDRCWAVDVLPSASVLLQFTGPADRPALLERRVGAGRCLLFTSAMDNLLTGGSEWNNFVVENWAFMMLADRVMQYLTGATDQRRNFVAGPPIDIAVPASQRFSQYLLSRPDLRQTRGDLPLNQSSVLITDAADPGHYRVRPADSNSVFESAFAVNLSDEESDLTRIPEDRLAEIFGPNRFALVSNPQELQQAVRVGRLGIELFPVLMGLLILLFCGEHLMANFFYDEHAEPKTGPLQSAGATV